MIIELKVQDDNRTLWDSMLLTREMLIELIDHNPAKLKKIISQLSKNISPKNTNVSKINTTPRKVSNVISAYSRPR